MAINAHKRILIAPLDWGMGHTTRCIPIMRYLMQQGHSVLFAGNEWQRNYITETFVGIETIHLDGYNVHYGETSKYFLTNILKQLPRILKTIKNEQSWLINVVQEKNIDAVISDNRYGLHAANIPCVFMTHQLLVQTGFSSIVDNLLRKIHYQYIKPFNNCWVVDVMGVPNLSGKLAHPKVLPFHAKYIGLLTQLTKPTQNENEEHILVLLSGPEPQRSIFAQLLWKQALNSNHKIIFIEGSAKAQRPEHIPQHITWYGQVTKTWLQPLLEKASVVISRSGYSTLMDLVELNKKAIIIPTLGQTEQEYLAKHLHQQGVYFHAAQKNFNLTAAIEAINSFPFHRLAMGNATHRYQQVLDEWICSLPTKN